MLTTKSDLLNVSAVAATEAAPANFAAPTNLAEAIATVNAAGEAALQLAANLPKPVKPIRAPRTAKAKAEAAKLPAVSPSGKRVPAKPDAVKPVSTKTAKLVPAKPKNVVSDAQALEAAKHLEIVVATRAAVAKRYSGASKAFHTSRATSPGDILAVIASPNHRIADGKPPTVRDASLAHVLVGMPSGSDAMPVLTLGADLGVISRLSSIGCFAVRNGKAVIVSQAAMRAVTRECRPTAEQLKPKAA